MKLWLLTQDVENGYDTYDSAVVAAEDIQSAKLIHPRSIDNDRGVITELDGEKDHFGTWAVNVKDVHAKCIGVAKAGAKRSVLCASFNAG